MEGVGTLLSDHHSNTLPLYTNLEKHTCKKVSQAIAGMLLILRPPYSATNLSIEYSLSSSIASDHSRNNCSNKDL